MLDTANRVVHSLLDRLGRAKPARPLADNLRSKLPPRTDIPIEDFSSGSMNPVVSHWTNHTVSPGTIRTREDSFDYFKEMDRLYPFYFEDCGLYHDHEDEVVLDFGCGPGNDVTGYFVFSKAKQIIGVDISKTALELARYRLALHGARKDRVRLLRISEEAGKIPLPDDSVDYAQSLGVIHHTTHPEEALAEIFRVLKPGSYCRVMIYNSNSLYVHLSVAYELQIRDGLYEGLDGFKAFQKHADCGAPIALCYTPEEFCEVAKSVGFEATYVGAAFSVTELASWRNSRQAALEHPDYPKIHKDFLRSLTIDSQGYPRYEGHYAGMDGVFLLVKPIS